MWDWKLDRFQRQIERTFRAGKLLARIDRVCIKATQLVVKKHKDNKISIRRVAGLVPSVNAVDALCNYNVAILQGLIYMWMDCGE